MCFSLDTKGIIRNALSLIEFICFSFALQSEFDYSVHADYRSIGWNLSKVIPRKDLPPIFTMSLKNEDDSQESQLPASLADLAANKDDVVELCMKAPKRRIDNVITNLYDSTSTLILYSKIWNDTMSRYTKEWRNGRLKEAALTTFSGIALGGMNYLDLDAMIQGAVLGTSILGIGGLTWYNQTYFSRVQEDLVSLESLSASFQRTHARQVQDADEYVASIWQRVRRSLRTSLTSAFEDGDYSTVSASELEKLDGILEVNIPQLRRLANEIQLTPKKSP